MAHPDSKSPFDEIKENEKADGERNRERRRDIWWNRHSKMEMVKRELTYEEWRIVDRARDEWGKLWPRVQNPPKDFKKLQKEAERLLKERVVLVYTPEGLLAQEKARERVLLEIAEREKIAEAKKAKKESTKEKIAEDAKIIEGVKAVEA
jgi:hypothetical protein